MSSPSPLAGPITRASILSSAAALAAAWMVVMATRYFSLQASDINGAVGVGVDDGSWLSTAYAVCEPIGVVIGAWLGIALSLRRMLLSGVAAFLVGITLPLLTPTYDALMLSRIITGLAGGAIMPQSIIIQLRTWGPTRVPLALALFLSAPTAAPQLGGLIGAWGVMHVGWSFVLWAAFLPGMLALAAGYAGLRREPIQWRPLVHADLAGLIALSAALGLFALAVSQGDRLRWFQTPAIPILFAASAFCLAMFVLRDWRTVRHPIIWARLYTRWNIVLAVFGFLPLGLAIGISGVVVPAVLSQVQHFRPEQVSDTLWSAAWPQAISYAACVLILNRKRLEVRALLIVGLSIAAVAAFLDLRITSDWQISEFTVSQLIQGIGVPVIALPLVYLFVGEVRPPAESLPAASVLNLSRVLCGTIATAWSTTWIRLNSQAKFGELLTTTGTFGHGSRSAPLASLIARIGAASTDPLLVRARSVQIIANEARRQAAVLGTAATLRTVGWLLFGSCLLAVLMAESGWVRRLRGARP